MVRTAPFQGVNPGSIPGRVTIFLALFHKAVCSTQTGNFSELEPLYGMEYLY
jgi:hypothetical protein